MNPKSCHSYIESIVYSDGSRDLIYDIDRSYGCYIYDSKYDRYILDCVSFFATNPVGYNHPLMYEKEFCEKILRVSRIKTVNGDIYTSEYADFIKSFSELVKPDCFKYVFFIEGGSAAIENALKISFDWKRKYNNNNGKVLFFEGSYHGRGGYTMSITNNHNKKSFENFPKYDWIIQEKNKEISYDPEDISCIILEPIQSVGGDYHFTKDYIKYLRKFCDDNNMLLIFDEIQTGVGLTGKMWCYEYFDIVPDIVVFGKKVQTCGLMATDKVEKFGEHALSNQSRLGSTFGGNLTDMIRAEQYFKIIKKENLIEKSYENGEYLLDCLTKLSNKDHRISNPRGKGLMCAFDVPSKEFKQRMIRDCLDNYNLLLFGCGEQTIRLRPSLIFGKQEIDNLIEILSLFLNNCLY